MRLFRSGPIPAPTPVNAVIRMASRNLEEPQEGSEI